MEKEKKIPNNLRILLIILTIFQFIFCYRKRIWEDKDWETLGKKAAIYFSDPSPKNTSEFLEALPRYKLEKLNKDVYEYLFKYENIKIIERQILAEDNEVIDIVYRLFFIADGHSAEMLIMILNKLIHVNPNLYLEKLKVHQDDYLIKARGLFFLCYTANLNSEEEALIEKNQRIEALKRVKDKKLIEIRDRCIEELKGCKNTFENIIKEMKTKKISE